MLRIVNFEEIQDLLLNIPRLITELEQKDPRSIENVRSWLVSLEQVLENNRMPQAGIVAGLRGLLNSALKGVIPTGMKFHGRTTVRKIREATAIEVLRRSGELITSTIHEDSLRIAEAERIGRQLIAVSKFKGLIATTQSTDDHIENLKVIWKSMQADQEIEQGALHLLGLIGPHDALIILDRGITRDK